MKVKRVTPEPIQPPDEYHIILDQDEASRMINILDDATDTIANHASVEYRLTTIISDELARRIREAYDAGQP